MARRQNRAMRLQDHPVGDGIAKMSCDLASLPKQRCSTSQELPEIGGSILRGAPRGITSLIDFDAWTLRQREKLVADPAKFLCQRLPGELRLLVKRNKPH
jgi:hypothetical protein